MKALSTIFSSFTFLFFLAAGAVVAEPPLPLLTFYQGDKEVESRRMTPGEHTAYMKFEHALGVLDAEATTEQLTAASIALAVRSLGAAADEVTFSKNKDGEVAINAEISIESLSEAVADGGLELGKYAERIGKATENLTEEVAKNSPDLEYDRIAIGEGDDRLEFDIDF